MKIDRIDTILRSFCPGDNAPRADELVQNVDELMREAENGCSLALEMLVNLSYAPGKNGEMARYVLAELYKTTPNIRKDIRALAASTFETFNKINNNPPRSKNRDSHPIPFELAYLANLKEKDVGAETRREMQRIISIKLPNSFLIDANAHPDSAGITRNNRYITQNELNVAVQKHENANYTTYTPLSLPPVEALNNRDSFRNGIATIVNRLVPNQTCGVGVHIDNHWVPLIFHREPAANGQIERVTCHVLDSSDTEATAARQTLLQAEMRRHNVQLFCVADSMQEHTPNNCGVHTHDILKTVASKADEGPLSCVGIGKILNDYRNSWNKLSTDNKKAANDISRMEILTAMHEAQRHHLG
jgi:hypothetical protein